MNWIFIDRHEKEKAEDYLHRLEAAVSQLRDEAKTYDVAILIANASRDTIGLEIGGIYRILGCKYTADQIGLAIEKLCLWGVCKVNKPTNALTWSGEPL